MKLPSLLALLSLALLANGAGTPPKTGNITATLPGKPGEDPTEIQKNIDRIQGEIKNLNEKVANLLSALNETNAVPFLRIDGLMMKIQEQQKTLNEVNKTISDLSNQINTNNAAITNLTRSVDCFKSSGCGAEQF